MKKFISLLLAALLLLGTTPVLATNEAPTVSISTLANGDTLIAGSAVALMAETNIADVDIENIVFYANGIKIPGTVTSASKSVVWTPATSGTYALTAKVTTKAGGEIPTASAVNVNVTDDDAKLIVKIDSDFKNASNKWLVEANTAVKNEEYTKLSQFSATMKNEKDESRYFRVFKIGADVSGYKYMYIWAFAEKAITLEAFVNDKGVDPVGLQAGWNMVQLNISSQSTIDSFKFQTAQGIKIPTGSGYPNEGQLYNKQTGAVYFVSAWVSKAAMTAPVATPSIPDGQENVCNQLKYYTLTFDQEMNQSTLIAANVSVTDKNGDAVTIENVSTSPNAMVLTFADNSFAYDGKYTVSLNNNIENIFGVSVGEGVAFDFSIVSSCENADPILSMTYPKSTAVVANNNAVLAAKVIFDGNVNKVEFYNSADDTLIGEATKGSDGEYYYVPATLAVGSYSVYAKVTYNESASYLDTKLAPVSFTVAEAVSYKLNGIHNGEKIFVNETDPRVLSRTIGLSTTDKVSKVIYKVDGVAKGSATKAPFTWEMPIEDTNTHAVSADVYDTMGGVISTPTVNYQAMYVTVSELAGNNFDANSAGEAFPVGTGTDLFTWTASTGSITYSADPIAANTDLVAKVTGNTSAEFKLGSLSKIPESKLMRLDVDLYVSADSNHNRYPRLLVRKDSTSGSPYFYIYDTWTGFNSGKAWNHVTAIFDFNALSCTLYVNDNYIKTTTLDSDWTTATKASIQFVTPANPATLPTWYNYYMDNLSIDALTPITANEPLIDKVTFTDNGTNWDADFVVTNLSDTESECIIYYAVYGSDNTLVSVSSEIVSLAPGAIVKKNYTVAKTYSNETGTEIRGFIWESNSGETTLRPLGKLK